MSLDMYGVPGKLYAPVGGNIYTAAVVTGLISAVEDQDIDDLVAAGCVGASVVTAAASLGAVTSVAGHTGVVTLAKADITNLGTIGTAAALALVSGFAKHALVAGAAAGNVTVTGIKTTDTLNMVLHFIGTGVSVTDVTDLTSQFTISATNTINNTSGTSSATNKLLVLWTATT